MPKRYNSPFGHKIRSKTAQKVPQMKYYLTDFGIKLYKMRLDAGLNVHQASIRSGVAEPTIRSYESGTTAPKMDKLEALFDIYGYKIEVLKKENN